MQCHYILLSFILCLVQVFQGLLDLKIKLALYHASDFSLVSLDISHQFCTLRKESHNKKI